MQYHAWLQEWCLGNMVPERREGCHGVPEMLRVYLTTRYVSNETPVAGSWPFRLCTSLASRLIVVFGLGTRLRVRMRTKLENGVLSNGH